MALLYQEIMNIPGLTGTWQQRNAQLYKALGSPMGAYKGNLQQNLYLLDQIKKKNYGSLTPAAQPAATTPKAPLADQYAAPGVTAGQNASATPQFESVMPFYDAWGRMVPQATQAAASQIDPELQRGFRQSYNSYMGGMTNAGGERFGRALGGIGDLKAATERDRNAQMQDWLNSYQKGYRDIFYDPSREAWNKAVTQGRTPDQALTNIPTWGEVESKYNKMYGVTPATTPSMPSVGSAQQSGIGTPSTNMTPIGDAYGGRYQTPGIRVPSLPSNPLTQSPLGPGGNVGYQYSFEPWIQQGISYDEYMRQQGGTSGPDFQYYPT